ncbi:hypothetical protein OS493_022376 [Desmophyllum pertusum]|uniref:Uncharacterized protein n=1 Tax=Desmophyllum pertusum TaxID=174260 RepID=A0A9W9ZZP2_9CNID|nr:hypothetical protein OS493_022376 [Desmophyllum pertusum]
MCLTEAKRAEQEQFVESAVKKQRRNKRKREPNMFVTAVLECTVRRICSDTCESYFCLCTSSLSKRRKLDVSEEQNEAKTIGSSVDRRDIIVPEVQVNISKSSGGCCNLSPVKLQEKVVVPEKPQCVHPSEQSQVEEFLHNLTAELSNFPSFEDIDELLREFDGDSSNMDVWAEEIETLLHTNTEDPFHPGLLEVLFT